MCQYRGLENKKILVVEDVEMNQYLARHIMESWGCSVEIAENGASAVDKVVQHDFDIVLMDIQMPVMDGIEATRQIRSLADSRKASVPVVALTANVSREDFNAYRSAGMNDCLAKPFEEAALFRTVSGNIRRNGDGGNSYVSGPSALHASQQLEDVSDGRKLYDLAMVEAISGDDKSFVTKMLQLFLDTVPVTLRDINAAVAAADWVALSKLAHKLKSTIDSMGIVVLKQDIRTVENNGKTGQNVDALPALVARVSEVMELVMQQVRRDYKL